MQLIAFDVETTGLKVREGERIIEIGMVELDVTRLELTGREFHQYLNPEKLVTAEALEVHGLDDGFLEDKPKFNEISEKLLDFVGDHRLIAHNAQFDFEFLNSELVRSGHPELSPNRVLDSLEIARRELPQLSRFGLDSLCRHFNIDLKNREKHGAMIDAMLLAKVYFRLLGSDKDLFESFESAEPNSVSTTPNGVISTAKQRPEPLKALLTPQEKQAHQEKVKALGERAVWNHYL